MVKSEALDPRINTNPIIFLFLLGLCSPNSSYLLALRRGKETIIKLIYRGEGTAIIKQYIVWHSIR